MAGAEGVPFNPLPEAAAPYTAPPMMIDVARARRDTPGCDHVLHFDNAGAALMPRPVLDAVRRHLDLEAQIGGYPAGELAEERLAEVYESLAVLLGCGPEEIAVVENATRAWDMAFYALRLGTGDRILTSRSEYASNYLAMLQVAERTGAVIETIPSDEHGQADVAALGTLIDDRVKLIAVSHVPTNGGLVQDAAGIGRIARDAQVTFLLDACQSVGQLAVNVEEIGCDILTGTSRKYLRGPRGQGFLYVRRELIESLTPPFVDLHAATWTAHDAYRLRRDARRFETWETNVAAKLGMGAAVDYALGWGLDAIAYWVDTLARGLRDRLGEVPGVELRDLGVDRCGIVTFSSPRKPAAEITAALREQNVNVSVSTPAATLLDARARRLPDLVRASVHYYNTEAEVQRFCDLLAQVLAT